MTSPQTPTRVPSGVYLRNTRQAAGLSLRDAAAALGVTHGHLGRVETGERAATPELLAAMGQLIARLAHQAGTHA